MKFMLACETTHSDNRKGCYDVLLSQKLKKAYFPSNRGWKKKF